MPRDYVHNLRFSTEHLRTRIMDLLTAAKYMDLMLLVCLTWFEFHIVQEIIINKKMNSLGEV